MLRQLYVKQSSSNLLPSVLSFSSSVGRFRSSVFLSTARVTNNRAMASLPRTPLFEAITKHDPNSVAVVHCISGRSFTYGHLLKDIIATKERIAKDAGRDAKGIEGERIAFVVENGYDYVGAHTPIHTPRIVRQPLIDTFHSEPLVNSRQQCYCSPSCSCISSRRAAVYPRSVASHHAHFVSQVLRQGR